MADEIASMLPQRVSSGEQGENFRLSAERDLAAEFFVSRVTVRLALDQLEESGALVSQATRGTFPSNPPPLPQS